MKRAALIASLFAVLLMTAGILACAEENQPVLLCEGAIIRENGTAFSYQLPQMSIASDADEKVNQSIRQIAQLYSDEEEATAVHGVISHCSSRYVSIELVSLVQGGSGERERLSAVTFARDGLYAGQQLNLSQLLGLEQDEVGFGMGEALVYDLLWQIVEAEKQNPDSDYLDELTRADLEQAFSPERDFYLDENGNVVFFIQAGEIAGDVAGILRFPFAPAELLSEM